LAAASLDVASVLNALGRQVLAHVGDSCSIALASPDGEWLGGAVIPERGHDRQRPLGEVAGKLRMRRGGGLSGKVFDTGNAVLIASVAPQEMAERTAPLVARQIEALRVHSLLAVALKTRRRTVGTITTSRYGE